jgi:hypothetical protein
MADALRRRTHAASDKKQTKPERNSNTGVKGSSGVCRMEIDTLGPHELDDEKRKVQDERFQVCL